MHGSNDFRSTKRDVYTAELVTENSWGIRLLAAGDTHARAQVRTDTVDLLALDRSLSGTNADDWLSRHPIVEKNPTLDAGDTIQGRTMLQVVAQE